MNEWKTTTLGNVCKIKYGKDHKKLNDGDIPVYGSGGIMRFVDTMIHNKKSVLIPRKGTLGNLFLANPPFWTVDTIFWTDIDNLLVDTDFLYYMLRTKNLAGMNVGTAVPSLTTAVLNELELNLPPIEIQKQIAKILSSIDDKIELNNKINDNLEQQAQAIFKSWFVDFEPFGGVMPSDWETKPLFDFAEFTNGTSFKKSEYAETGLPIVKIAELKNGITSSTQYFNGNKDAKFNIFDGDILFSWSGNPLTSIDIFIWDKGNAILNQHTFKVVNYDGLQYFMYLMLKHFKKEFCDIASHKQTTGLGHVTIADLKRLQFHYSKEIFTKFDCEVEPLLKKIFTLNIESQKLAQLRDTLLPKLMSGEIDVSQVEV